MPRRWVVNASPLILLGKVDHVALLLGLSDQLIVPAAVVQEVAAKPDGQRVMSQLRASPTVHVASSRLIPREIEAWDLGPGESAVLAHAAADPVCRIVIDDLEARRCARSLDIDVIGTLGVVLRAARLNLIPKARPVLDRLREVGLYLTDDLVERAFGHWGE